MAATPQMLPDSFTVLNPQPVEVANSSESSMSDWKRDLQSAIRSNKELCRRLNLSVDFPEASIPKDFPVLVTESFLRRMRSGDINDPLLVQVLPVSAEVQAQPEFLSDPVGDLNARKTNGLLHKYHARALLVLNGNCAIHCRYCFRREYPYSQDPKSFADWEPAFLAIERDSSLQEVILSGGDPLLMTDQRLSQFLERIAGIPHVQRVRIHSRLPIVLPSRVTSDLISLLCSTRLQTICVVHANHPRELVDDCEQALRLLVRSGIPTLNQAVLLKGVNDHLETLVQLCESCVNLGVLPYYLHQLDRVRGAAHFEVPTEKGLELMRQLRLRLPGYAVPKYVREIPGELSKTPLI